MRIILILLSLLLLSGCSSDNALKNNEDFTQVELVLSELKSKLKNKNLWDYELKGPFIFVNKETRVLIANEPDSKNEFIKQGDYYVGYYPENMNIANTALDWNGKRWTVIALPLPETREERLSLLIHESFHRIQPSIGFDSLYEAQSVHLDSKNGRIYLKLELEALKMALKSENPEIHIKNALLFRLYRYKLFSDAKEAENSLELNEGLAEYTGSFLSRTDNSELQRYYLSKIEKFNNMSTFVRSFAYFTIPVYGYIMQQTDERWNLKITKNTNLTEFMLSFFKIDSLKIDKENINQISENYGIKMINEFETKREFKQQKQIKKYIKTFLSDSIVSIGLENMKIGFNPSNIFPLDSFGTVYPNLRITDNWGVLIVDSCGALVSPEWDKVIISYPNNITDTLISGRGWQLKLNNLWKLKKVNVKYIIAKK